MGFTSTLVAAGNVNIFIVKFLVDNRGDKHVRDCIGDARDDIIGCTTTYTS